MLISLKVRRKGKINLKLKSLKLKIKINKVNEIQSWFFEKKSFIINKIGNTQPDWVRKIKKEREYKLLISDMKEGILLKTPYTLKE